MSAESSPKATNGMFRRTEVVGNGRYQTMDSIERRWQGTEETGGGRGSYRNKVRT